MGLRFCATRAHSMTPYRVLYVKEPMLPSTILIREFNIDKALDAKDIEISDAYVTELAVHMAEIHRIIE